jgi:hypothetical protein
MSRAVQPVLRQPGADSGLRANVNDLARLTLMPVDVPSDELAPERQTHLSPCTHGT